MKFLSLLIVLSNISIGYFEVEHIERYGSMHWKNCIILEFSQGQIPTAGVGWRMSFIRRPMIYKKEMQKLIWKLCHWKLERVC